MKLTDEMRREAYATSLAAISTEDAIESIFLAGYRMGARDMRKRAAKACAMHDTGDMTREDMEARRIASRIRGLPIEDEA